MKRKKRVESSNREWIRKKIESWDLELLYIYIYIRNFDSRYEKND